jgi:hypothetical protein
MTCIKYLKQIWEELDAIPTYERDPDAMFREIKNIKARLDKMIEYEQGRNKRRS